MPIKISQQEYTKKFGQPPVLGGTKSVVQPSQGYGTQIGEALQGAKQQFQTGMQQAQLGQSPMSAVKGAFNIAASPFNAAMSPLAPVTNQIGKAVQGYANTVSEIPQVQKFAQSKVGQTTSDIAEITGNAATIAGGVEGLTSLKPSVSKVATGIKEGVTPAIETTGRALKSAGEGTYGITVPPSEATAKAMLSYDAKQPNLVGRVKNFLSNEVPEGKPITEANTAARHGLVGTEYQIGVQAKKIANGLWEQNIAPKLDAVKGQVNMKNFFDLVEKDIIKNTKELGRRNALKEALQSMRENYQKVNAPVNLKTLQQYKEGWAKFIPEATYKGKPIGSALKDVQNMAAGKARDIIYKYVGPEGKQAYLDYGNLQSIIESGAKSITGDLAKKSLGRDIWQGIMDKAVTPVATLAGKVLYKTGEGLEFVGKSGAKKVKDVIDK